jgi:hypothetical protein
MKQIAIFFILGIFILSCEKDETMITISSDPKPASLTSVTNGFAKSISKDNLSEVMKFEWSNADYGVNTQITYVLQMDSAGKSFVNPVVLGTTQSNTISLSLEELNNKLLNELKVRGGIDAALELRVISSINNQFAEISPAVSITVKTLKLFDINNPPTLWVPGGYQGWDPATAPVIYGTSETEFEGFVYINAGTGFKFTSAPDWTHINYGDSGTPGVLTTDGLANGMSASEPGYYRFKVNVQDLTYEMYKVTNFGLIGTATSGSWDNSTPMTYNESTGVWSATADLVSGALKFRANNSWDVNYGPEDPNAMNGKLITTDGAITISEPGNYTITLDFTKSHTGHHYQYTVVKNVVVPTPAKLWIPGGFQSSGGNPSESDAFVIYTVPDTDDKIFEGYFTIPSATWIKFTTAADWSHTNYGSTGDAVTENGTTSGTLTDDGTAPGIDVSSGGYYKIVVNTADMTYSLTKIESWGLIGTATPGSWDNSTPMVYDATTKKWSKTVDLVNGALKFRANNAWSVNYGPEDSNLFAGVLIQTDAAITISEAGSYTVTIDLSRSAPPFAYTYTVTKN